jgi:hypothetical protein
MPVSQVAICVVTNHTLNQTNETSYWTFVSEEKFYRYSEREERKKKRKGGRERK